MFLVLPQENHIVLKSIVPIPNKGGAIFFFILFLDKNLLLFAMK